MNHQHWLHTRLEEAAKDPETVHNKRWMLGLTSPAVYKCMSAVAFLK